MKLIRHTAPFIRRKANVERMMLDVIIALMPIAAFAVWQRGWAALSVLLVGTFTFILVELIAHSLMNWPKGMKRTEVFTKDGFLKVKESFTVNNIFTPLISGLIYSLIMPAGISLYVTFIGALFGSLFGKMVFGGLGQNIFNPAGVGRIVTTVSFAGAFQYLGVDIIAGGTALQSISGNIADFPFVLEHFPLLESFFGFIPGSMGEVNSFLILLAGAYLFIRRSADLRVFISMLIPFATIMAFAGLSMYHADVFTSYQIFEFVLFNILSGAFLFTAVFMATDPITSPVTKFGRIIFGFGVGALTAYIRLLSAFPEGAIFALILMNMFVPMIDSIKVKTNRYTFKQFGILLVALAVLSLIIYLAI